MEVTLQVSETLCALTVGERLFTCTPAKAEAFLRRP